MALGMVQAGYRNSLFMYSAWCKSESDFDYAELLAELTTELELACKSGDEEPVTDEGTGEDSEQTEAHLDRKKEWEELLEQTEVVEAMLRQMLENGLGQQKEEQQKQPAKNREEELDNDFALSGVPAAEEGRQKDEPQYAGPYGNSEFLQSSSGSGSEYFSSTNGSRMQRMNLRTICLTCQVECDQKKQWKITE